MSYDDVLNALRALDTDEQEMATLPVTPGGHLNPELARPAHIRSAFDSRDATRVLRFESAEMAVVTKLVPEHGFVWVIVASRAGRPESWIVGDALRVYGDATELDGWASDPLEAFATALDRYGMDFRPTTGGRTVRFAPFARLPVVNGQVQIIAEALGLDPDASYHVAQSLRITEDGEEAQLAFAYFVNDNRYAHEMHSASRRR